MSRQPKTGLPDRAALEQSAAARRKPPLFWEGPFLAPGPEKASRGPVSRRSRHAAELSLSGGCRNRGESRVARPVLACEQLPGCCSSSILF